MNPKNRNKFIILGVLGAALLFFVVKPFFTESEFDRKYRENMEKGAQAPTEGTATATPAQAGGAPVPASKSQFQKASVDVDQLIASIQEISFNYDTDRMPRDPMTPLVGPTAPTTVNAAAPDSGAPGTTATMAVVGGDAQSVLRSYHVTGILWDKHDPMAVVTYPVKGELASEVITRGFKFPDTGIVVNDIEQERVVLNANGTLVSLQLEER